MKRFDIKLTALLAITATSALAYASTIPLSPVWAQDVEEDSVLTRTRPEFDPLGIRAGSFLVFPQIRASTRYDDNIFARESNEEDDIIVGVEPSVNVRSQWSRHQLNLQIGGDVGRYLDNSDSSYEDFGVSATGRVDVVGESAIRFGGFVGRNHEDRDDPEESGQEDVTEIIEGNFIANYRHVINRLFIQPGIQIRRRDFDDVNGINNDDRDIWRYAPSLRVGFAVSPGTALFANVEFNQVIYDETPDDRGVDRDSQGFAVTVGSEFDLTGKLLGEIQAGFQAQEFDDSDLDDFSGARAEGAVTYNLTPLTALQFSVGAGLEETTVSLLGENASANFRTTAGLQLTHEFLRNLIFVARGNYIRDDFEGIDRTDDRFGAGATLSYALNRNLSVDLDYDFTKRSSDLDGNDFDRNVVRAGLTARF